MKASNDGLSAASSQLMRRRREPRARQSTGPVFLRAPIGVGCQATSWRCLTRLSEWAQAGRGAQIDRNRPESGPIRQSQATAKRTPRGATMRRNRRGDREIHPALHAGDHRFDPCTAHPIDRPFPTYRGAHRACSCQRTRAPVSAQALRERDRSNDSPRESGARLGVARERRSPPCGCSASRRAASRTCGYPPTPFAGGRDVLRARRERPSTADVRPHLTPSRRVDTNGGDQRGARNTGRSRPYGTPPRSGAWRSPFWSLWHVRPCRARSTACTERVTTFRL